MNFITIIAAAAITVATIGGQGPIGGDRGSNDGEPPSILLTEDINIIKIDKKVNEIKPKPPEPPAPVPPPPPTKRQVIPRSGRDNGYVWGNCTYYVKEQKPEIPNNWGDARNWPINSDTPQVGAIIVTYESRRGHVGITEAVDGDIITITEMNYAGFNVVSHRTVNYKTLPLKGFYIL